MSQVASTRTPRRRIAAVALLAQLLASAWLGTSAAQGTPLADTPGGNERATFGIGPAESSTAQSAFSFQSAPGGRYTDRAVVANYGRAPLRLTVFATDLRNDADGGVVTGDGSAGNTDAGAWVSLAKPVVTVSVPASTAKGPGAVLVPFTFRVPLGAEPGDHGAAIVAQLTSFAKRAGGQPLRLNQRVATRVYIRVAGALRPKLEVQQLSASYHGTWQPVGSGSATVSYLLKNTGNIRLGAAQQVSIDGGWWGRNPAPVAGPKLPMLLPGGSQQMSVVVQDVTPSFRLRARVVVTPLLQPDQPVLAVAKPSVETAFLAIPWGLIVLVAVVLTILLVALTWLRRGRKHSRRRTESGVNSHRRARTKGRGRKRSRAVVGVAPLIALVVSIVGAGPVVLLRPAVAAAPAPFTDPARKGSLGFCNASGKAITSGSVTAHPFVSRVVSSVAASAQYSVGKGAKATLYAFQPREGVEPSAWSGRAITAASFFSSVAHPMAEGTELDYSLADFLSIYPARRDGLVQLRLFLGAPNTPAQIYPYAATTIEVTGSRWKVVDGGPDFCSAGQARSTTRVYLSRQQYRQRLSAARKLRATQSVAAPNPAAASANGANRSSARGGDAGSAGAAGASNSAAGAVNGQESPTADASRQDNGGGSAVWWVVGVLAIGLAGSAAMGVVRRRRT